METANATKIPLEPLHLTRGEMDCLMHRLTAPDAIIECLSDADPESPERKWHPEDVASIVDYLNSGSLEEAMDYSEAITFGVLADCVEGSTWYGYGCGTGGAASDQRQDGAARVGNSLAMKIGKFIGRKLVFPEF